MFQYKFFLAWRVCYKIDKMKGRKSITPKWKLLLALHTLIVTHA